MVEHRGETVDKVRGGLPGQMENENKSKKKEEEANILAKRLAKHVTGKGKGAFPMAKRNPSEQGPWKKCVNEIRRH